MRDSIKYYLLISALNALFFMEGLFGKDAFSVARKVERNGTKLGLQVAGIGILLAGVGYVFGKHDANEKLAKALIGTGIICAAGAIVATIKNWI